MSHVFQSRGFGSLEPSKAVCMSVEAVEAREEPAKKQREIRASE